MGVDFEEFFVDMDQSRDEIEFLILDGLLVDDRNRLSSNTNESINLKIICPLFGNDSSLIKNGAII